MTEEMLMPPVPAMQRPLSAYQPPAPTPERLVDILLGGPNGIGFKTESGQEIEVRFDPQTGCLRAYPYP